MGVNRGKDFEKIVQKALERIDGVSIDRLHDQTTGFKGSSNICDFIVYSYPHQWYIECKTCYGNTLNFHNITDKQWIGLLEKSKIRGVIAGYIVWFIDKDVTLFITADTMKTLRDDGAKSLRIDQIVGYEVSRHYIVISGKKKQVFFDYNIQELLDWGRRSYG